MKPKVKVITAVTSMAALALVTSISMADITKRIHYRAWCQEHAASPGGWMSYESHAKQHKKNHEAQFPNHKVKIESESY